MRGHGQSRLAFADTLSTRVMPDVRHLSAIARSYLRQCWQHRAPVDLMPWLRSVPDPWRPILARQLVPPWLHFSWCTAGARRTRELVQEMGLSGYMDDPVVRLHVTLCERGLSGCRGEGPAFRFGRFFLRYVVGTGSHGIVYRAWDPVMRRDVAIKFALTEGKAITGNLHREATVLGTLPGGPWPTVHDYGCRCGIEWLISGFERGRVLHEVTGLARIRNPRRLVSILVTLACAVARLHRVGFVHGDLWPGNILLARSGRVILLDFCNAGPAGDKIRRSGSAPGAYRAPETARDTTTQDPRSDVYALGVIIEELRVRAAGTQQGQQHGGQHDRVSELDDRLRRVAERAACCVPSARFPTAGAMLYALRSLTTGRR